MKYIKYLSILFLALFIVACKDSPIDDYYEDDDEVTPKWVLNTDKSDEFDQWDTNKWVPSIFYSVTSDFAFNPNNVTVSGGQLRLAAKKESYNGKNYTSAVAFSKFLVGNNTLIEIRAKTIDYRANVTTALWISEQPTVAKNPNLEIDIMETLTAFKNPTKITGTIHYWWIQGQGDQALGWKDYFMPTGKISDDYHIYKLERRNNRVRFYFDEILFWDFDATLYQPVMTQEKYVIFSIEGHAGDPVDAYLPGEFLIDYLRVYDYK